jgi:HAT1-interacting factor 1
MSVPDDSAAAPADAHLAEEQTELSQEELQAKLAQLQASATQQYSLKNYDAAAEFFSEAAQIQDQLNGEMSPENADLLYQYGRCLYHLAVAKSDVLGGKVASEEPKRKKRKVAAESSKAGAANSESAGMIGNALKDGEQKLAEEVVEAAVEEKDGVKKDDDALASKPYFQITGDENWTDSEDDDAEDAAADAEAAEEEDDFATAYEILDMARLLLKKKLDAASAEGRDGAREIKERLADTHDLQAEISLENERFADAITDTREGLKLKMELYPDESSLIAEAHFKLSLALEFASVTSTSEDGEVEAKVAQVDEKMRVEAADEMELAIASCNARIAKEEAALAAITDGKEQHEQQKSIADVKEMVADMKQRLVDLRSPAVSLSGIQGPAGAPGQDGDPLRGVLGAMLGESKAEQAKRIEEATKGANDLSGLVKHKKKPKPEPVDEGVVVEGKGKRKADVDESTNGSGKKVKFAATVEDE